MAKGKQDKQGKKFSIQPLPWPSKDAKEPKRKKPLAYPLPILTKETGLCWNLLAKRESGKSTLVCNLIRAYYPYVKAVYILSPTVFNDPVYKQVLQWENVYAVDEVTNEQVLALFKAQAGYDANDPDSEMILAIIDDSSEDFKRKHLRQQLTKLYTKGRHAGIQFIICCHNIQFYESPMINNSNQWSIWDLNTLAMKTLCGKLATRTMSERDLSQFIETCIRDGPYSFAFINYKDPYGHKYYHSLDRPYEKEEGEEEGG